MGGGDNPSIGSFSEHVVVQCHQVIEAPSYIDDIHIAAWPVAGVTAWRFANLSLQKSSFL